MKSVISFLVSLYFIECHALVAVEGSIFGKVNEQLQQDPLSDLLSYKYTQNNDSQREALLQKTYAFYQNGEKLKNKCDLDFRLNYSTKWEEETAKRSVVATLQYLGLDVTLKSIARKANILDLDDETYKNLVYNLVYGSCSPNLSVYSLDLLEKNFYYFKDNPEKVKPFQNQYQEKSSQLYQSIDSQKRDMSLDIKNFRAFCSWNSHTEDYRLLVPYLKSPYIMADLFNSLLKRKISFDSETISLSYLEDTSKPQVACENFICRTRSVKEFQRIFPRMIGRTSLEDDLIVLYCDHFSKVRFKESIPSIMNWRQAYVQGDSKKEALHYAANLSNLIDIQVMNDDFSGVPKIYENNVKYRWDLWANTNIKTFYGTQFYEESLEIRLSPKGNSESIQKGEMAVNFDINYGELDQAIQVIDKLRVSFNLSFSKSFLGKLKERIEFFSAQGNYEGLNIWQRKTFEIIKHQIKNKDKYFFIPIWDERIANVITSEVLNQLSYYKGKDLDLLNKEVKKIPVHFRVGVFAMQYLYQKRNQRKNDEKTLTFK